MNLKELVGLKHGRYLHRHGYQGAFATVEVARFEGTERGRFTRLGGDQFEDERTAAVKGARVIRGGHIHTYLGVVYRERAKGKTRWRKTKQYARRDFYDFARRVREEDADRIVDCFDVLMEARRQYNRALEKAWEAGVPAGLKGDLTEPEYDNAAVRKARGW